MQGEVENQLLELGKQPDAPATYITRPGLVQRPDVGVVMGTLARFGGLMPSVRVDQLAAAMIGIAIGGAGDRQIWDNAELVEKGTELLSSKSNQS